MWSTFHLEDRFYNTLVRLSCHSCKFFLTLITKLFRLFSTCKKKMAKKRNAKEKGTRCTCTIISDNRVLSFDVAAPQIIEDQTTQYDSIIHLQAS